MSEICKKFKSVVMAIFFLNFGKMHKFWSLESRSRTSSLDSRSWIFDEVSASSRNFNQVSVSVSKVTVSTTSLVSWDIGMDRVWKNFWIRLRIGNRIAELSGYWFFDSWSISEKFWNTHIQSLSEKCETGWIQDKQVVIIGPPVELHFWKLIHPLPEPWH